MKSKFPLLLCVFVLLAVCTSTAWSQENYGGKGRLQAWKQHQELAAQSPFKDLTWQRMGPKFAGGRIESIACPANDLGTIYAGIGAGGVWKTTNGGMSWKPIFENQSTYSIGDVALAPSDPDIIWVGTGEAHLSRSSYAGNGVYKSVDGGATWQNMGLHESEHIGSVVVAPNDSDTVYVAAMGRKSGGGERGVYKTTDGGKTFKHILSDGKHVAFVDLVIDPFNPNRIFVSAWDRSRGNGSGVYRSNDAGETWKKLAGGLLEENVDRVAIDVSQSKEGVVYAIMADRSSPELARRRNASVLFRSDDRGETWKRTHEDYVPTYIGWDFCDLRIAPDDANRLYVGGVRLITSSDGGKTFQGEGGFAINRDHAEVLRVHRHPGIGVHLDVHDIWIDPHHPERVLLGNDGGLFSSLDRGSTWLHLNNLPICEFYRVHLDNERPFNIWGGTQDNASLVGPATARYEDGKEDLWRFVFLDPWTGGDGFATFPDPNDAEITYYTQQNGDLKRSRMGRLRAEKRIRPRNERGKAELQFAWDTPFFASSHPGDTILYCGAQRVFRSTDRGDSWKAISPDFGSSGLLALSESPLDPKRLACGGAGKPIHVTLDGGENWNEIGDGIPRKTLRDIEMSHHDAEVMYVAVSGKYDSDCTAYVFHTNDFGKTWTNISANLPAESVNSIEEDPTIAGLLYVGTDSGVYVSLDNGQSWHSLSASLPCAPVVDLEVHARDGKLVAATHGLSIFIVDIQSIRSGLSPD